MTAVSILNHVLGPVMRGPSSSHTAGSFHIGCMARCLLGDKPKQVVLAFDPHGSLAATYVAQGADRGFAMGLMGRQLTDESFFSILRDARAAGVSIEFEVRPLDQADHPNSVEMQLTSTDGRHMQLTARSVGGGQVEVTRIDGRPVLFDGAAYETLVEISAEQVDLAREVLGRDGQMTQCRVSEWQGGLVHLTAHRTASLSVMSRDQLCQADAAAKLWESAPVYFPQPGKSIFNSAETMVHLAEQRGESLGQLALSYESELLGMSPANVLDEMLHRYDIMVRAVERGLDLEFAGLQMLPACAGAIFQAESAGRLSVRSLHTRAAARAMAVMHVDSAMGVVCAAPTGGSAGVIPGSLVTLAEERSLGRQQIAEALLAAGAIGVILATRATFAAEIAGCQVEIGASGAMAAAAVVDAVGGTPRQACNAAAISLQNTIGSVCDLLHGTVEIPCHTRNGSAAAMAFVNADLILGGYVNVIPLDETIDAVYSVGLAMPSELRCTSQGGLAMAPSARALKPIRGDLGCAGRDPT